MAAALLLLGLQWLQTHLINAHQATPYMDEEFHIRQAGYICEAWNETGTPLGALTRMKWDPKLTTPPGLYVATLGSTGFLACGLSTEQDFVRVMRWSNFVFCLLNFFMVALLTRKRGGSTERAVWVGLACCSLPPLFMTSSLYYTDPGGLFFVLLTWYADMSGWYGLTSLAALASLGFRQTNVVWILFVVCERSLRELIEHVSDAREVWWRVVGRIALKGAGPMVAVLSFFAFLWLRIGSIALGDKTHHELALHWPQLAYFGVFAGIHSGAALEAAKRGPQAWTGLPVWSVALLGLGMFLAVQRFTIVHPFILADNRHFTFYLHRKIFARAEWLKLAMVPAYVAAAASLLAGLVPRSEPINASFVRSKRFTETLGFLVALVLNLVPMPLVEPRYFVVPTCVYTILLWSGGGGDDEARSAWPLRLVAMWSGLVNLVVGWAFVYRPFVDVDGSVGRFMW